MNVPLILVDAFIYALATSVLAMQLFGYLFDRSYPYPLMLISRGQTVTSA